MEWLSWKPPNKDNVQVEGRMQLSRVSWVRRIINSNYHPFHPVPKCDKWPKRERLQRFIAWQYNVSRNTVRYGYERQNKIFHYLDMQRRDKIPDENHWAGERVRAALAEQDLEYGTFRGELNKAHILLNDVVLAQLAVTEPRTFQSISALTRAMARHQGRDEVLASAPFEEDGREVTVVLSKDLFQEPLPLPRRHPLGPSADHKHKPRKLTPPEF